ncbi:CCR4-NOT transcription complex subunit 4 [Hordeum vulgare]|uniref:CCR4-NOT transcription complex subunit 4 n=1 Tax=Hordeum vulgare subsp. vulgare TaxID=112509 RepID=A0A8I6X4C7_HORVV|nr:flocculation protein FLO11-like [Hordeum vulgare subsp. vulgare]KAE8778935.1 CCR4-NOT transcription complex subunit 4 [Hordeum vulgare]
MSTQAKDKCPLCMETMDLTDKQLKPCKCGYEICLWCWHHIMEMDQKDECGGRCPGCRSIYNKDTILGTSISNQILKELCADKSILQHEQMKLQKQKSATNQLRVAEEPIDHPDNVRVIQRKLVYIVGMPSEFASEKVLRQKSFLGQYGKIENIIIDNIGANQQIPDSGRVYVTFSREEEAVLCIEAVNGFVLDGRPLKATFGVTRYCHIWLSNKVCQKPNCSYVHKKALPEDVCSKDDVGLFCARIHHLLGMNMKGPQQRSGVTLPSPGGCNTRTTMCSGNSKDKICVNDVVVPRVCNKNPGTLPAAIPRDSIAPSVKPPSVVNTALLQQNNHESVLSQQKQVSKSQELPPLRPKDQLASSSNTSVHLGNGISDSKKMTSEVNGTVETSWRKPQYANIVTQGSSGPARRLTVLTRELISTDTRSKVTGQVGSWISSKATGQACSSISSTDTRSKAAGQVVSSISSTDTRSKVAGQVVSSISSTDTGSKAAGQVSSWTSSTDTRPKATGQVGSWTSSTDTRPKATVVTWISNSKKLGLAKDEGNDRTTIPRYQAVKGVSQRPEEPSHRLTNQLSSAVVKPYVRTEEKNACSDTRGNPVQVKHMQAMVSTATALESSSSIPTMLSNLSSSNGVSQTSAGPDKLSNLHRKLPSENQSQILHQQKAALSNKAVASGSILSNQVVCTDGKHQSSPQGGDHSLCSGKMALLGDKIPSEYAEKIRLPRPVSDILAKDSQGRKRLVCPPGFSGLRKSPDSGKSVSMSSSTCSALRSTSDAPVQDSCSALGSTSDAPVQDSCSVTDQPDIISWVSECLEDDGDHKQSSSVSISSTLSTTDTIWRPTQAPGPSFGASNHCQLPPYHGGLPQSMCGDQNPMRCCCTFPSVSNRPNQMPEYWNGSANSYMAPGGYDTFYQNWTNGSADSGLNSAQVDLSYSMYTLF